MIELPPERCTVFVAGERVLSLSLSAEVVRARVACGRGLLVMLDETCARVPAECVERVEEGWDAYGAALEEGFRELIEEPGAPTWKGAAVNAG